MTSVVTLFKKKQKNIVVHFDNGPAYFHEGRFATRNKELEEEIKSKLKDHKIFIDPEEPTVDLGTKDFAEHVNDALVASMISGPRDIGEINPTNNPAGVGISSTANNPNQNGAVPRFANATSAQLKARLEAARAKK